MIRKFIITLVAVAAGIAGVSLVTAPTPASAEVTQRLTAVHRVSHAEFNAVKGGWTQARVHRVFETNGKFQYEGSGNLSRTYRGWARGIKVTISYVRRDGRWVVGRDKWGVWKYAYDTNVAYS